jgi:hypothetical protein
LLHRHTVKLQFSSLELDVFPEFMHFFIGPHQNTPCSKPSYNSTLYSLYDLNQATPKLMTKVTVIQTHRETSILLSWILHFPWIYAFFIGPHQKLTRTMLNFNQLYIFINLHFFSSPDNRNLINCTFAMFHFGGGGGTGAYNVPLQS